MDKANIYSINFNSKHSVISINLKTPLNQARIVVPHKVDIGSDRNIMPLHVTQNYSLGP